MTGQQTIAIERMWRLFELAQKEWAKNDEGAKKYTTLVQEKKNKTDWQPVGVRRSRRYIALIRGFSTRFRIAIPREIKDSLCKTCGNLWVEGVNVKRRVKGKTLNSNCLVCNTLTLRKAGK